ncbi:hypothetical protein [Rummeliibacillus sp. TYF-LIM-RU47]|uniref:hypothetical protein n=1 Tax=Rummeliibacillus sp. TYF-LIM-RU47 TaxID=2608406 RepID=UPI00123BB13E|nr:hypothetical protein [Rummeliibacillus sp. TYF-LIM-RU47]
MEYSSGMGIEIPVWVIQSANGKRTYNRKTNSFQTEVTEECIFDSPTKAYQDLKLLDYGYVVKSKRYYQDANNNRIW